MNYPKGSEWRKWDLHLHTPSSYDYKDNSVTNKQIIETLTSNEISVVAITDHHIIDIERIKELQSLGKDKLTILPGIEFLSDARGRQPIHFIGIFAEDCNLEHVWGQIENKTKISEIKGKGLNINEVYCDLDDTISLIHELGGIVTIHAGEKHSSIENITHSLEHGAAQKTDIANKIDFYELGKSDDQEGYKKHVFPSIKKYIPMILCSDNHNINTYKLKVNCWIKANPTFKGLTQVIYEPEERVFIGDEPEVLKRVQNNRTKYINNLYINKVEGYSDTKGKWFNNIDIELNSELVAIIGNKGSGKSAISDIIALLGNSYNEKHFSFLNIKKFRKGKLAENFKADLTFQSEEKLTKTLNSATEPSEVERVRYLPQNYFEELCNDLEGEGFENALKNVVFSHLEDADKLETVSFDDLIALKINSIEKDIEIITPRIDDINKEIIALEEKKYQSYKATIISKFKLKYEELLNHVKNKPTKISKPNNDSETNDEYKKLVENISLLRKTLKEKEELLREKKQEKQSRLLSITELKELLSDISRITKSIEDFKSEKEDIFNKHHLNINDLVKFSNDLKQLEKLIDNHKKSILEIDKIIFDEENSTGLEIDISTINSSIITMEKKLSEPEQNYRKYQAVFSEWKKHVKKLIGTKTEYDTIKFYMAEKKYLKNDLINDIANKREERINLSLQIYDKKFEVVSVFKQLKETIDNTISKYDELLANYDITIEATFKLEDFEKDFLSHIQQNRMGSFYGADEGRIKLQELLEEKDFDDREVFKDILNSFILYLEKDFREDERYKDKDREIVEQVKDVYKLYDYIFNLSYLVPNYELKLDNKGLVELSPGEKGALLLVFFLMLDKEEIPLIIDQPEDNLDNQSVYKIVVQFIKNAKKRRQIIMVTHNPNLAVVADAEQVIYAEIDKQDKNKFSIKSGAIEDEMINQCILDILEGTRPAFETRRKKYF